MSLCRSCNRYMSSSRFSPSASDVAIGRCLDCTDRDNAARHRNDFSRFKIILRRLQADELRLSGEAQMPFLLQVNRWAISLSWTVPFEEELTRVSRQVEDVRYLVEVVWTSRSVLHGSGDLYDLVLVRWDRWKNWSPWNCILLSKNEAKAHMELEDINKVRTPPETGSDRRTMTALAVPPFETRSSSLMSGSPCWNTSVSLHGSLTPIFISDLSASDVCITSALIQPQFFSKTNNLWLCLKTFPRMKYYNRVIH